MVKNEGKIQLFRPTIGLSLTERERLYQGFAAPAGVPHVLLKTCDRIELYTGDGKARHEDLRHVFRLTSGLESPLFGEKSIQGQVKRAFVHAQQEGKLSPGLYMMFEHALRCGKRVRRETGLDRGNVSHWRLATQVIGELENPSVLMLGCNKIVESMVKELCKRGNTSITVINRTESKSRLLASRYGIKWKNFSALGNRLPECDVLVSVLSNSPAVIHRCNVKGTIALAIDLGVPRNIDPKLFPEGQITRLYDVERLEHLAQKTRASRTSKEQWAEQIIAEEVERYYERYNSRIAHKSAGNAPVRRNQSAVA